MLPEVTRARLAAWCDERRAKLASIAEPLAEEVKALAYARIREGGQPNITPRDLDLCWSRVVSRVRVARFGALPSEPTEALRQHNEIRTGLGLKPLEAA